MFERMTAADIPADFEMFFQEQGHGPVPFGSKGAGEESLRWCDADVEPAYQSYSGADSF
jgi:hypothetical protein